MSATPALRSPGFSRRTLLGASAAALALLATGCTSSPADERETVTSEQADELATQLGVQEALVPAYGAATVADPALESVVAELAAQAGEQLERLRAAAPKSTPSAAASTSAAPAGPEAKSWLRAQVAAAATSHAAACVGQSGARAALLGSIAAGLRGQDGRLA
jgi:enoyl-[acyl-carrier-protein] reductase (NADH)